MSVVLFDTTKGQFSIELDAEAAPKTVANFLEYVNAGFYDGTIFHRVIDGFMVQGGGFEPGMDQKSVNDPVENEADNGLKNDNGTIAMARTSDPHSATAQFFVNVKDNDFLNHSAKNSEGWGYCVFGKVVDGMAVVEAIKAVNVGFNGPHQSVPVEDVVMTKVSVAEAE